jgi:hypothetical protein
VSISNSHFLSWFGDSPRHLGTIWLGHDASPLRRREKRSLSQAFARSAQQIHYIPLGRLSGSKQSIAVQMQVTSEQNFRRLTKFGAFGQGTYSS